MTDGKAQFVAGSNQLDMPLTFASTCNILWERNKEMNGESLREEKKGGELRTKEDCEWDGEKDRKRDVTESSVSSSDFTVYWSRKHWTLDEILIQSEKNRGIEKIKKIKSMLVLATSILISSSFHFISSISSLGSEDVKLN